MMKRTAALSALIAVALSGTVFAASVEVNTTQTTLHATASDKALTAGGDLSALSPTSNPIWIRPAYNGSAVISDWDTITYEGSKFAPNAGYYESVFYTNGSGASLTLNNIGTIQTDIGAGENQNALFFNAQGGDIIVNAKTVNIKNVGSAVRVNVDGVGDGSITINAENITLNGGRGVEIYDNKAGANSGKGTINITATDKLDISAGGFAVLSQNDANHVINLDGKNGVSITGETAAVYAYGGSQINIGQNSEKVDIEGDIWAYSADSDASVVNVDLGENGSLEGTVITYEGGTIGLELGTDSVWTSEEDSWVTNLTNDGGNIVMNGDGQTIWIDTLEGDGGTVTTNSLDNKLYAASSTATNTTVKGTAALTETIESSSDPNAVNTALDALANVVDTAQGTAGVTTVALAEGALLGTTTAIIGANGVTNVITKENIANAGLIDMTALSIMTWRGENDDLNERLGDLRNSKEQRGIWARMSRAEQTYNTVSNQYSKYQIGYDQEAGDWTLGAAYSYTDGKSHFAQGTGENTHNVFSLYGTKMNKSGTFVDLVAKYGNLDYDYTLAGGVGGGEYDTDAYSFSAEAGKRITSSNGVWVEPQVQLTYGMIDDVAFKTKNGFTVKQDSVDSFVARAGIMAGKPVYKGNIYLKASYLYDFAGEVDGTFSNGARNVDISRDLGGGWWEVGFGANFNLSDVTHMYLDFEKAFGGEVEVEWKWNAGVRYSF